MTYSDVLSGMFRALHHTSHGLIVFFRGHVLQRSLKMAERKKVEGGTRRGRGRGVFCSVLTQGALYSEFSDPLSF